MPRPTFSEACAQYVNRYTCEHVPAWADHVTNAGFYYAPQFATDAEWYAATTFPGEPGHINGPDHCHTGPASWPLGQRLQSRYIKEQPAPAPWAGTIAPGYILAPVDYKGRRYADFFVARDPGRGPGWFVFGVNNDAGRIICNVARPNRERRAHPRYNGRVLHGWRLKRDAQGVADELNKAQA